METPSSGELLGNMTGKGEEQMAEKKIRESSVKEWKNNCSGFPAGKSEKEQRLLARNEFWLGIAVFILIGLSSLMAWNVMLNLAPYMAASYFDGKDYGNTFLACFQGACISVQIAFIYFKCKPKPFFFYTGAAINIVAFLAVTPAASECGKTTAAALVHLLCILWGAASGILQGAGYAYAGALPVNFAVFLSAGQGIAGLAAFALNTLLGFVFFDLNTRSGLTNQSWILYSVCALFSAILAVCLSVMVSRPWARQPLQDLAKQQQKEKHVGRNLSSVIVRVETSRRGSKLVGQKMLLTSEEIQHTEQQGGCAARQRDNNTTKVTETVEGQNDPAEVWTDLLEAECSGDTAATMAAGSRPNCGLQLTDRKMSGVHGQTVFSHPLRKLSSQNYAGNRAGPVHSSDTAKPITTPKDCQDNRQSMDALTSDIGGQLKDTNLNEGGQVLPKRNVLAVARQMWNPLLAILVTFFVTLNLFPRVGPVGWHYSQNVPNHFVILFGLFSIADTLGRSTPSLQMMNPRWLGWTLIPERIYLYATFTRVLFYVPFFLSYKLENRVVLNDFWWLSCVMLLFAFTHGWFTSLGFVYAVGKVSDSDKDIAGPLSVVGLSVGILLGLYIALAY